MENNKNTEDVILFGVRKRRNCLNCRNLLSNESCKKTGEKVTLFPVGQEFTCCEFKPNKERV